MSTSLDAFQTALLTELRDDVARSSPADRPDAPPPVRRPRRRLVLAAALVGLLAGGGLLVPALLAQRPAYAVVQGANGVVDVEVHRLEDAAGLERALADAGVRSDVTYLPRDTRCAAGRFVQVAAPVGSARFEFVLGEDGYRVALSPGVVADDQTLVISVARVSGEPGPGDDGVRDLGGVAGSIGVAEGAVAPCEPRALP
ncbi:hypothetical protein SAMN04488570_2073 [Nocardioides scoriae]|uniref:Uncharacterized protein n=1 Tax=Nocardioides scoriae TaxID=642780 RepID=A0A1H1SWH6_9ACTN|nr:hypothetical protein [Nocardioides scoriae]SDS52340.1 hypothetical protein SAMN04488570_2073 [Nocardioides scoriae]